jgi:hypothetical protein
MVSAFEYMNGKKKDYWMQAYPTLNKISLSFLTKETASTSKYGEDTFLGDGIMLWPEELAKNFGRDVFKPKFTCAYPVDAATGDTLGPNGCGGLVLSTGGGGRPTCQFLGIYTKDDYLAIFGGNNLYWCGFGLDIGRDKYKKAKNKKAFAAVQGLSKYNTKKGSNINYDEILMKGWDSYNPSKIPLLGFFYTKLPGKLKPYGYLEQAQRDQLDFYKKTNLFAPIIQLSGDNWANVKFDYIQSEQSPGIPENVNVIVGKRLQDAKE